MTGLPYLGTVAACSGRVVAMTSPGDKTVAGKFNWARVLKHELVHVITLDQTKFNIPHWYTEGLAVHAEDTPRPASWTELLRRRVPKGELFTLDTINFGFTRPDSSDEWQMAYCQAELYVDYILDRHSPEALGKLLAAYADGLTTRQAIPRALGTSQEEFERGYVAYLQQLVSRYSGRRSSANGGRSTSCSSSIATSPRTSKSRPSWRMRTCSGERTTRAAVWPRRWPSVSPSTPWPATSWRGCTCVRRRRTGRSRCWKAAWTPSVRSRTWWSFSRV